MGKGKGKSSDGLSGHALRKERRKEERRLSKKRSIPLVPNFVGHDSTTRTNKRKMCMFITGLQRAVEREEEHLRHSNKKPPQRPKTSGLRGAAKPAWEKYPELYPEMHVVEPEDPAIDLIAKYEGACFEHVETRTLVSSYFQLGYAHLLQQEHAQAQKAFKRALELDTTDALECRHGLLFASNNLKAVEKLGVLERALERDVGAVWHMAVVLKTEDSVARAVEACPEVAMALEQHAVFEKVIDTEQVVTWIRDERIKHLQNAVETGVAEGLPLGRFDAGLCITDSPQALAVCYFTLYSHLWIKDVQLMAWMSAVLKEMEVVDSDNEEEEEEAEEQEEEEEEPPIEVSLVQMFEEALAKCNNK